MSEDFSIRTTPVFLDGVFRTLAGVPDLWAVIDGPRCVVEMMDRGILGHAWRQRLMRRDGDDRLFMTGQGIDRPTDVAPRQLLARLEEAAARRGPPGAVLVSEMAPARLIGNDLPVLAEEIAKRVRAPATVVKFFPLTRDALDGFSACLCALAESLPDASCKGGRDSVGVIGHLLDRTEADQLANVQELESLLTALGVKVSAVWTSGQPLSRLAEAGSSRRLIALPLGEPAAARLAERSGASVLSAPLPIGLAGTSRWLRRIAARFDRKPQAERFIAARLEALVPLIGPMVSRVFAGRRVLVIAEPALAEGLSEYLEELGMEALGPLWRCRRQDALPKSVRKRAQPGPRLYDPSQESLQGFVDQALREGPVDLVIGSSLEREMLSGRGLPFLELGFPSFQYRPLVPSPDLGFSGALHLAHRLSLKLAEARPEAC